MMSLALVNSTSKLAIFLAVLAYAHLGAVIVNLYCFCKMNNPKPIEDINKIQNGQKYSGVTLDALNMIIWLFAVTNMMTTT